jgi:two-component system sensor histidine kinase KdpD
MSSVSAELFNKRTLIGTVASAASIAAVILLLLPFKDGLNTTEVALTLLLVVLLISTFFGSRAGLAASVAGILGFNFFFLPPFHTFTITGNENWAAFAAFVVTALVAGQLSGYARRRAAESERQKEEIEGLYDELRQAFDKASEAEALKRSEMLKTALLDAITHDLRTPLTSIKASVTTLLDDPSKSELDQADQRELLEVIDEETDRLNDFVEGIVGIAKVESGAFDLLKMPASIDEIIEIALVRASRILGTRRVVVETGTDLPQINVDRVSIAEVIYTLLDNAAKYSGNDSLIRVRAGTALEGIQVSVEDQGAGIGASEREKIFKKFYRVSGADIHTTGSGLGLGLAIAKGIVESHGGRIWAADGDDDFVTKFTFTLPESA